MKKFLVRNDDIAFDTDINEIKEFCAICDEYEYKIIQAITPRGECRKARVFKSNEEIKKSSDKKFEDNQQVVEFLKSRNDLIGVHGLWHTHCPSSGEIKIGKEILKSLGFSPIYFVPPFNEGDYSDVVQGLETCKLDEKRDRLEGFLRKGEPQSPIMYLHSWRFNRVYYTFDDLRRCFQRLKN